MENEQVKQIKDLLKQAANSLDADDALKYSEAAMNAANTLYVLKDFQNPNQ